ncbi:MAG: metallophosphoesterase [Gammaproteobacteria bacterium]|nr:metallophosphoesterase [Gammaproteobacteria bacterium]
MKILAVGDMHLGRRPSRLPPGLVDRARELGPAGAWRRTVEAALETEVRAVALAGDVVEKEDDFFEAYRELAGGVRTLTEAGIDVVGVAGNHDVKVLPRLADDIPEFKLLGKGGQWEPWTLEQGTESLTLWGWSFPQPRVQQSPLPNVPFDRQKGLNLGLLHCDRNAGASPYAPVTSAELARAGLDGWLLGHIHKPDALTAPAPSGYLGSLSGLSRKESGVRGPWLITVAGGTLAEVAQLPLAPLRWERREVDIGGIDEAADAKSKIIASLQKIDAGFIDPNLAPEAVALDLRFTGRTRFGNAALDQVSQEDRDAIYTGTGNRHYFIESLSAYTRPEIELEQLAEREDALGLLAQRLLWLQQPEGHPDRDRLVALAKARFAQEADKPVWSALEPVDPDPVEWLTEAGYRALDQLIAQSAELA